MDNQDEKGQSPRKEGEGFVEVGDGKMAGLIESNGEAQGLDEETEPEAHGRPFDQVRPRT